MHTTEGAVRRISRVRRRAFCLFVIAWAASGCGRSQPSIHLDAGNPSRIFIEIRGLSRGDLSRVASASLTPDEWSAMLRVSLRASQPAAAASLPAMAGRYTADGTLRFWPAFPL